MEKRGKFYISSHRQWKLPCDEKQNARLETMSKNKPISDLCGTGKRVTVQAVAKERIPIGGDIPLEKFYIQEEDNPKNWVAAVVFDEADSCEIEVGSKYLFENVIDHRFEDPDASYAPQLQLKADEQSNIQPADDGCMANPSNDDGSNNESAQAERKESRPTLSGPGKNIRSDGPAGERVSGRNPLNNPRRIKDAGLHQGSP